MKFSGHETFSIRESWLFKGLGQISKDPASFSDPFFHDFLGVGSNMGKSIKHWLLATGLIDRVEEIGRAKNKSVSVTEFGQTLLKYDPYLSQEATLAFLHVNLINSPNATAAWSWFFNTYPESSFTRIDLGESMHKWAAFHATKQPSYTTLQKDLNCLLASYAKKVPADQGDPEEAMDSPFWDLGLLTYYRGAQRFRVNRLPKTLPGEVIGYSLAVASKDQSEGRDKRVARSMTFDEAAALTGGPNKAFLLSPQAAYETVEKCIADYPKCGLKISSQAGQRVLEFRGQTPIEWVASYYQRTGKV